MLIVGEIKDFLMEYAHARMFKQKQTSKQTHVRTCVHSSSALYSLVGEPTVATVGEVPALIEPAALLTA